MGRAPDIVVNGVRIGPQSDLFGMFRRAFLGEDVFPSRTAYAPQDGVTSVMRVTRGTALEQVVTQAIMRLLTDSESNVRAGAVMAIETFPLGFDGRVLLRIMDEQPSLFKGIPATVPGYSDLYWELLRAIAGTGSLSREVLNRLKESVTDPVSGHWLIAGLTRSDPD